MNTLAIPCITYSLNAEWYEGVSTQHILLVLMGYGSTRAKQVPLVSALVRNTGMSALVIDYSGHGDSPFSLEETRPAQHFMEVICAYDWIKRTYPDSSISVMGASFGGYLASRLVRYREVNKLLLRVPAIYEESEFYTPGRGRLRGEEGYQTKANLYRKNTQRLLHHPVLKNADAFKGETLVVIHENDDLIPPETTAAYTQAFNAKTYVAKGFHHSINESPINDVQLLEYQNYLSEWLHR